ncbi:MAG: hypothetical protein ACOVN7_08745, partial [Rubrivivax sp.]
HHLIPTFQPSTDGAYVSARRKNSTPAGAKVSTVTKGRLLTQHTGLPPRETAAGAGASPRPAPRPGARPSRKGR